MDREGLDGGPNVFVLAGGVVECRLCCAGGLLR